MVVDNALCFQYRRHRVRVSAGRGAAGTRFTEARNYFHRRADQMSRADGRGPLGGSAVRGQQAARRHVVAGGGPDGAS